MNRSTSLIGTVPPKALILANLMIGTSSLFVLFLKMDPIVMGFYRMAFSACIFFAVSALCVCNYSWRSIFSSSKTWWLWMVLGALFWVTELITWQLSISEIGPGGATLLNNCQIFIVPIIFSLFGNEKGSGVFSCAWAALALVGLLCALRPFDASFNFVGAMYGFSSGVAYSGYVIAVRMAGVASRGTPSSIIMQVHCILTSTLFALLLFIPERHTTSSLTFESGMWMVVYAAVCQVGGWTLIQKFSGAVSATSMSIYLLAQPITALVLEWVLCNRQFGFLEGMGILLVMLASLGVSGSLRILVR
jgi:drug/metabolite transporter (DMT)-like permease